MKTRPAPSMLATLALLVSSTAIASPVIHQEPAGTLYDPMTEFVVDTRSNTAWVSLYAFRTFSEDPYLRRITVNGLRYDPAAGQVMLATAGGEVACGSVTRRGVGPFKTTHVVPSGKCELSAVIEERSSRNPSLTVRLVAAG